MAIAQVIVPIDHSGVLQYQTTNSVWRNFVETIITVVVIGAVIGLLVMMVKYAGHIHHFSQKPDQATKDKLFDPDKNKTKEP